MKRTRKSCKECGNLISVSNLKKHENSCDGNYFPTSRYRIRTCKYCEQSFDIDQYPRNWMANHVRWCEYNPKRNTYNKDTRYMRSCIKPEHLQKAGRKIKELHANGHYDRAKQQQRNNPSFLNKKHSKKTKELLKQKALASPHRRLRRKIIEYNGVLLDSTWELILAQRFDKLGIKWTRPDPLTWIDEDGITHNYFPDFYLPEYDLYIDPKNKHAINVQKKKLNCLLTQYKNIVILNTLEACKSYDPRD